MKEEEFLKQKALIMQISELNIMIDEIKNYNEFIKDNIKDMEEITKSFDEAEKDLYFNYLNKE